MRTLKKTLCLVLALVMVLGVCAFGASAEFTDADEINYAEAVAVLSGIGVINGIEDADGNFAFQPAGTLTRAQAAKIIAYVLGADDNELSSKSSFTDCAGHWADGAIAFVADKGIVAGVGDNKFNPDGKLTGFAFAKMLLCAVGFDAEAEGLVGDTWTIKVATLAKKAGINNGIEKFDGNAECSREQAAQMAFNALQYSPSGETYWVVADKKFDSAIDAVVYGIMVGATPELVSADDTLMAENFPTLKQTAEADAFGRPAAQWVYGKNEDVIYNEVVAASKTFTVYVNDVYTTNSDFEDAINTALKLAGTKALTINYDTEVYFNGELVDISVDDYYVWAGDQVDVYVGADKKTITTVAITDYDLVKIVAETKLTKTELDNELGTAYKYGLDFDWDDGVDATVYDKDFAGFAYAKGDYVLVAINSSAEVLASKAATIVEGKVTAYKAPFYTIGGASYACADTLTVGAEYKYVANEANVLEVKLSGDATSSAYAYIYALSSKSVPDSVNEDGLAVPGYTAYTAYVILEDGSKASYPVTNTTETAIRALVSVSDEAAFNASTGAVVCYSVNAKGQLEIATADADSKLKAAGLASATFGSEVAKVGTEFLDNETAFIFVSVDSTKKTVTTKVVTGYKNLAKTQTADAAYIYSATDKTITSMFVLDAAGVDASKPAYAVLVDANPVVTRDDKNTFFTYTASVAGENVEMVVKADVTATSCTIFSDESVVAADGFIYEETDGYLTKVTAASATVSGTVDGIVADYYVIGGNDKKLAKDAEVYLVTVDPVTHVVSVEATQLQKDDVVEAVINTYGQLEFVLVTRA